MPTGEKKKGIFGGEKDITEEVTEWEQTGWSDCEIDGQRLTQDIQKKVNVLCEEGYEILSIMPITSGAHYFEWKAFWNQNG